MLENAPSPQEKDQSRARKLLKVAALGTALLSGSEQAAAQDGLKPLDITPKAAITEHVGHTMHSLESLKAGAISLLTDTGTEASKMKEFSGKEILEGDKGGSGVGGFTQRDILAGNSGDSISISSNVSKKMFAICKGLAEGMREQGFDMEKNFEVLLWELVNQKSKDTASR